MSGAQRVALLLAAPLLALGVAGIVTTLVLVAAAAGWGARRVPRRA